MRSTLLEIAERDLCIPFPDGPEPFTDQELDTLVFLRSVWDDACRNDGAWISHLSSYLPLEEARQYVTAGLLGIYDMANARRRAQHKNLI